MKIGLYSPFAAETLGGGERYLLTIAECLLKDNQVDLIVAKNKSDLIPGLKQNFSQSFNLKLNNLNIVAGPFGETDSAISRWFFTRHYDVFYYMTDGSFFIPGARLNIAHFMIPFNQPPKLLQRLKLNTWQVKTTHSYFCKEALERIWKIKIDFVHWGAVEAKKFKALPKQNLILSVGRWFSPAGNKHCKRQDFLVATFKKMYRQGLKGWQLVLTGAVEPGSDNLNYLKSVQKQANGYPIKFHLNADFKQLLADYGESKIYWHATGYGQDEQTNPQAMEHFGISTIEAMAAGAVPAVINKGGQKEIVNQDENGLLWSDQTELMKQTMSLVSDNSYRQKLAQAAQIRAKDFSLAKFYQTTNKIFGL